MKEIFTPSGARLTGRLAELYSGDCPPERPCTPEQVALYRKEFDKIPAPDPGATAPANAGTVGRSIWRYLGQIVSYAEAMARWKAAGSPVASEEVQAQRAAICFACPKHRPDVDGCRVCGCGTEEGGSLEAKRSMATESCPDDPVRWPACWPPG